MGLKLPIKKLLGQLGKALVNKYADEAVKDAESVIDKAADTAKKGVRKGVEKLK